MTNEPSPRAGDDLPEWATAAPDPVHLADAGHGPLVVGGILLLLVSVVLVGVEAWHLLDGIPDAEPETVWERLGWPMVPGVVGLFALLEVWRRNRSIDL
ncbi:hypothetical protein [Aeromicrobium sp. Leaf350]|uniref:hypothetical protein n=1 Tax=Aeromicrobium sp. Leaf350 TaxID=2876565 RepID=UPI001E40241A|nr:hypothetical protein [Aeromicrobium sp. Leaf350]